MGRHLSKHGQKERVERIVQLRDEYHLDFQFIAERLNMQTSYCYQLYNEEKERLSNE